MSRAIIELTEEEQARIRQHCVAIQETHKLKNSKENLQDRSLDPLEVSVLGVSGEYALCKFLGIDYPFVISEVGGDRGWDLDYRNGKLEVKTVQWKERTPELRVGGNKVDLPYTHLVLVKQLRYYQVFEVLGWATKKHFAAYGSIQDRKINKMMVMPVYDLFDCESLRSI